MIQQAESTKGDETTGRNGFAADQAEESGRPLETVPASNPAWPEIDPDKMDIREAFRLLGSTPRPPGPSSPATESPKEPEPETAHLPVVNEFLRSIPNHIARSSLFAPIARKTHRKNHRGTVLASRQDASIRYWGDQLSEDQADVWLQALYLASKAPLGQPVKINRAQFLRDIGRHTGPPQYAWLKQTMHDLTFGMLVVEVRTKGKPRKIVGEQPGGKGGKSRTLHLISGYEADDDTGDYLLTIDPRWVDIYGNREYALIDWPKRLQIGQNQDLAKALQRLVATTNQSVQRYSLDELKGKMEYHSPDSKFRISLAKACAELSRLNIIHSAVIEPGRKGPLMLVIYMKEHAAAAAAQKKMKGICGGLGKDVPCAKKPRSR